MADSEHTAIATGIQELLQTWNSGRPTLRVPNTAVSDLGSATDAELFAALDELGVPGQTHRSDSRRENGTR